MRVSLPHLSELSLQGNNINITGFETVMSNLPQGIKVLDVSDNEHIFNSSYSYSSVNNIQRFETVFLHVLTLSVDDAVDFRPLLNFVKSKLIIYLPSETDEDTVVSVFSDLASMTELRVCVSIDSHFHWSKKDERKLEVVNEVSVVKKINYIMDDGSVICFHNETLI